MLLIQSERETLARAESSESVSALSSGPLSLGCVFVVEPHLDLNANVCAVQESHALNEGHTDEAAS